MNWKGNRKDLDAPPATPFRLDAARMEEEIRRLPPEAVSEYAPLRERIDQAGRLSMQEAADACSAILADALDAVKKIDIEHQRVHRLFDELTDKVQRAAKDVNSAIVRHSDNMNRICEVLEMVQDDAKEARPAPKNSKPKTLPAPIPENEDATK